MQEGETAPDLLRGSGLAESQPGISPLLGFFLSFPYLFILEELPLKNYMHENPHLRVCN